MPLKPSLSLKYRSLATTSTAIRRPPRRGSGTSGSQWPFKNEIIITTHLNGKREEVDLFEGLDLSILDEATQLGHGDPFLLVLSAAATASGTSAAATSTATTASASTAWKNKGLGC